MILVFLFTVWLENPEPSFKTTDHDFVIGCFLIIIDVRDGDRVVIELLILAYRVGPPLLGLEYRHLNGF